MKLKKLLILIPALLLGSCNFKYTYVIDGLNISGNTSGEEDGIEDAGEYDVKIWVDDKIVDLTRSQIGQFVSDSMGKYKINATIEPVSEASAAASMLQDPLNGADIFIFAQDQLSRLKVGGALTKVTGVYENFVKNNCSEDSVQAASINNNIYAYPITNDNGYFLYYDKSILSDSDVTNVSSIISRCKATNSKFYFKASSDGFYSASYFIGMGCSSTWEIDDITGKFTSFSDNYNSDNGLIALKGFKEIADKSVVVSDINVNRFRSKNNPAAAVVSGIWDYEVAQNILGDDLGCAELPNFTVDGIDHHIGSFDGFKLMGVKPQVDTKKASVCRKIARFLIGESCQTERFNVASWGPTNNASSEEQAVLNHKGLAALRNQHEYAMLQVQCPGSWFSSLATAAKTVTTTSTDAELRTILNNYAAGLEDLLSSD